MARMDLIPGLTDIESSTEGGNPELQIRFDRDRLANLGVSLADVATAVRAKLQGSVATDIQREDRAVDIRLRAGEEYRDSVQDLLSLTVYQQGKVALPLSAVASVEEVEGPAEIRRVEGERAALITANLVGRDLGAVSEDIAEALEAMDMPPGFSWRIGGQRQEMETSFDSLRLAILLAIFMVYLVMASQFESLIHPFVILFSVPFSLVGVLITLWLFDVTVSIVVLIGGILLAGIVVNNAIILIDYTNQLRREDGLTKLDALRRAGQVRLRPILMTTATTVLGLLPMAIGLGEGSELRSPMALTVIGGLLASTALTLLLIPALYSLVDRGR
jgi:HAE1 family hydrophobic/amphiphilic exporter-1